MLESEPENNTGTNSAAETQPTARPRRRAASRPAGPPRAAEPTAESSAESSAVADESAPATPAKKTTAKKAAAKKTTAKKAPAKKTAAKKTTAKKAPAKKTAAKKTATAEPEIEQPTLDSVEAPEVPAVEAPVVEASTEAPETPAKRTTRKRTAKKATTPRKSTAKKAAASEAETPEVETEAPAVETPDEESTETDASIEAAIQSALNAAAKAGSDAGQDDASSDEDDSSDARSDDDDEDSEDDQDDSAEGHSEGGSRRRRRRRGGRRRRRGRDRDDDRDDSESSDTTDTGNESGQDESAHAEAPNSENSDSENSNSGSRRSEKSDDKKADDRKNDDKKNDDKNEDDSDDEESGDDSGRRRRRRRRRRRGEDTAGASDDPSEVVVRVREPRKAASDQVTGIDGSTRMEAKRQRRREGREAGRRRAPIISEAEFLARRESVNRKMIIRQRDDLAQIAVLEDGILVEHYVDRESANSLIGNVYLGRVQNVLPSMEAAFIDIGRGRNAVLYAGEVDWESFGANGPDRKVERVLKSGQTVLVQVTKDPVGAKGARLTNHVSIPGRYVVYAPGGHLSGISRKLPDTERKRLKDILDDAIGDTASVIVRTAAEGASEDELTRDVNRLKAQWEDIEKKVKSGTAPQQLYAEPDLTLRIVRDLFTEDFSELIVQGNASSTDAYDAIDGYVQHVAPHLADRMRRWDTEAGGDLFGSYRLDEQIAKGLERKVFLPSGGSLIIDRTEAMTVIDVNTGKFTGSGGNLEATVTSNNLEAAEEIVRQLRLRDIGGIIVIDFIDMVLPNNRELLLRRLVECLGRDRTRHQVAEVTSLGLVQMTRKRIGTGLLEAFSTECPHCHGRGAELHEMPVADTKLADGGSRDEQGGNGGNNGANRGGSRRRSRGGKRGGGRDNDSSNESSKESAPVS